MKNRILAALVFFLQIFICSQALALEAVPLWARSVTTGSNYSWFQSATVDLNGNVYAAGGIQGSGTFNFGNGVTVAGTSSSQVNIVLVKYDSNGNAIWAKSVIAGTSDSRFLSVAVDSSGNIYAAGIIGDTDSHNFGNGVTVSGACSGTSNILLVKYDNNGNAQWAKSVTTASNSSKFNSVAIDSSGNVYAVGGIQGSGTFNFGNGVTVSGAYSSGNVVLVKYDSNGNAQWAKSTVTAPSPSEFNSVALDSSNNAYVAGKIGGNSAYDFGNGVTVTGASVAYHAVIVKYDSSGNAQWARSTFIAPPGNSEFNSVALDSSGNIYAVGYIWGSSTYNFGNDVAVSGAYSSNNIVLVKYDNNGNAQWAKSTVTASASSEFNSLALGDNGNIYASGYVTSGYTYGFGNGVTVIGGSTDYNILLLKYDSNGNAQWAKSVVTGSDQSSFYSIVSSDNSSIYAAGQIYGNAIYDFGNDITVTGATSSLNALLVKYGEITLTPTPTPTQTQTQTITITPTPTSTTTKVPTTTSALTPTSISGSTSSWLKPIAAVTASATGVIWIGTVNYYLYKTNQLCYKNHCKDKDPAVAPEAPEAQIQMEEEAAPPEPAEAALPPLHHVHHHRHHHHVHHVKPSAPPLSLIDGSSQPPPYSVAVQQPAEAVQSPAFSPEAAQPVMSAGDLVSVYSRDPGVKDEIFSQPGGVENVALEPGEVRLDKGVLK